MTPEPLEYLTPGGSTVRCWPSRRYLETVLPDGSVCTAAPNDDAESRARAKVLGYGEGPNGIWRLTVEHEICHSLYAEAVGRPYSPTLHAVATGGGYIGAIAEEEAVLALQRYSNDGTFDPVLGPLGKVAADVIVSDLKRAAGMLAGEGK